jgi:class 3 adenylate cyclase
MQAESLFVDAPARPLPTGMVTFLLTDIEGSTRLWETQPDAMRVALARHDVLLRKAIGERGGQIFEAAVDEAAWVVTYGADDAGGQRGGRTIRVPADV